MSTERIDIQIREDGSRVVKRSLEDIGTSATKTADKVDEMSRRLSEAAQKVGLKYDALAGRFRQLNGRFATSGQVPRELQAMATQAGAAAGKMDLADKAAAQLKRALVALGGAMALIKTINIADQYATLQNRLRTVTKSTEELSAVTERLNDIANGTRQSFGSTVELFTRMSGASKELGVSQNELLNFTESLNQAVVLSGATAAEASASLIQLGQGMASGTLRGDELRSVLEQLPIVADVIAKSLGVTRGELRQLGTDGKITADTVLRAFAQARGELADKFAKSVPTVGQALQVLNNKLGQFLGEADQSAGVTTALARALLNLSNNLPTVARSLGVVAVGMTVAFGPTILGHIRNATNAVRVFMAAVAANPIGALVTVLATAIAYLTLFRDELVLVTQDSITLGDYMRAVWEIIRDGVTFSVKLFRDSFIPALDEVRKSLGWFGSLIKTLMAEIKRFINDIINGFVSLSRVISVVVKGVPKLIKGEMSAGELGSAVKDAFVASVDRDYIGEVADAASGMLDDLTDRARKFALERQKSQEVKKVDLDKKGPRLVKPQVDDGKELKKLRDELQALVGSVDPVIGGLQAITDGREILTKAVQKGIITDEYAREISEKLSQRYEEQVNPVAALNKEVADEVRLLGLSAEAREIETQMMALQARLKTAGVTLTNEETDAYRNAYTYIQQATKAQREKADALKEIRGPIEEALKQQRLLNELVNEGSITTLEFNQAMMKLRLDMNQASFSDGFISQLEAMQQGMDNFSARAGEKFATLTDSMIDGFADATAKSIVLGESFSDNLGRAADQALTTLISSLIKLGVQMAINAALGKTLGTTATAASIAQAKTAAVAWAPAAAGASLATVGANSGPATTAMTLTYAAAKGLALSGFRTGGEFTVGGAGGPDSQLVAFRATPGEKVHVNTPAQARAAEGGGETNVQVPVRIVNVTDPAAALQALNTPDGERTILNIIENNPTAIRRMVTGR